MSDSAEKRALDSKAITDYTATKAETESQKQTDEDTKQKLENTFTGILQAF
jgi:hypothetical protein